MHRKYTFTSEKHKSDKQNKSNKMNRRTKKNEKISKKKPVTRVINGVQLRRFQNTDTFYYLNVSACQSRLKRKQRKEELINDQIKQLDEKFETLRMFSPGDNEAKKNNFVNPVMEAAKEKEKTEKATNDLQDAIEKMTF